MLAIEILVVISCIGRNVLSFSVFIFVFTTLSDYQLPAPIALGKI